jgi:hypothetical protein
MNGMERIKAAFALLAVLAMSGTGWAKPSFGGPGVSGELNGPRTEAMGLEQLEQLKLAGVDVVACDDASVRHGSLPTPFDSRSEYSGR